MQLPLPPMILLAMASLEMIATRVLRIREKSIRTPFLLLGLVLPAAYLLYDRMSQSGVSSSEVTSTIWARDILATAEQWLVLSFGALAGLACWDPQIEEGGARAPSGYFLFLLSGLMFTACANDFLTLGLSIEIVGLSLGALNRRTLGGEPFSQMQHILLNERIRLWSSGFMWYGIALMANATSTTQLNATRLVLINAYAPEGDQSAIGAPSKMILLASGLIVISQFARMGFVPFHSGLVNNRRDVPLKWAGLSILAQQIAGSIVLTRLFSCAFAGFDRALNTLVMAVVLATFTLSGVIALRARAPGGRSLSQWLSGVVLLQSGWLGVGFMIAGSESANPQLRAAVTQPLNETLPVLILTQLAGLLTCGGTFWIFSSLRKKDRDVEFIEDLKGVGRESPVIALSLTVVLASMAGVPWTVGFWVRWLTLLASHNLHGKSDSPIFLPDPGIRLVTLVGILATLSAAVIAVRLVRELYLEAPHSRLQRSVGRGSLIAGIVAATATIVLGIAPQLVLYPLASMRPPNRTAFAGKAHGSGTTPLGMTLERSP